MGEGDKGFGSRTNLVGSVAYVTTHMIAVKMLFVRGEHKEQILGAATSQAPRGHVSGQLTQHMVKDHAIILYNSRGV